MHCPTLKDLPTPQADKTGWPWTLESAQLPASMPDGKPWPKISIVTPSFNQGQFIEETIRSILLQGYPNLEYIIVDGGSADDTVEVLKKYEPWLTYWVSEIDVGQADAINKGLQHATGEWFNWINSDDLLTPRALFQVAMLTLGQDAVAGVTENFDSYGVCEYVANTRLDAVSLVSGSHHTVFHQPSFWLKLAGLRDCGGINSQMHYVFDWEMLIRYLGSHPRIAYTEKTLARFRLHETSKTVSLPKKFEEERQLALTLLRAGCLNSDVRFAAGLRCRHYVWWNLLKVELNKSHTAQWLALARIAALTMEDPGVRLSRLTFGALRQVLMGRVPKNV